MDYSETVLVTGACGQIGSELVSALCQKGIRVIATDIRKKDNYEESKLTVFETLDILDKSRLNKLLAAYSPSGIYHLAALLSATSEKNPQAAWEINMRGLLNVLDSAVEFKTGKVFYPSSIAVFGSTSPAQNTPQHTVTEPGTVYGISKLAGERWCEYYFTHKNLDVRSLRYPGLISYKTKAGGGTTDYAVDMIAAAAKHEHYDCYLEKRTKLPMMYMTDAIKGTLQLMDAPASSIKIRSGYNFAAFSFSAAELETELKKHFPTFSVSYKPDFRQQIADSWPESINDKNAQEDWGWKPQYNFEDMVRDMYLHLTKSESLTDIATV